MDINFKYLKDKDIFEMQVIESQLRAHFLLGREAMNKLRITMERALLESKKGDEKQD